MPWYESGFKVESRPAPIAANTDETIIKGASIIFQQDISSQRKCCDSQYPTTVTPTPEITDTMTSAKIIGKFMMPDLTAEAPFTA
jgi:hypothetical protein